LSDQNTPDARPVLASQPDVYDLANFSLSDMTRCGIALRKLGSNASSMEEVARRVVELLYRDLVLPGSSDHAAALVRTFVTLPYSELQPEQQEFARHILPGVAATPAMKCLTLLATAGQEPEWNARTDSAGHQALPLPSEAGLARSPMIAQLIRQLGIEAGSLLKPDSSVLLDSTQHTFNVFHVSDALGSPYIPAQSQFVVPYGIRSVIGFGGVLPPGELFATIIFARTAVTRDVAELFKPLALNVKVALLPFAGVQVFE
jgi:two-component system NtrC family sensor kinase